jgi:hypothetical protein
MALRLLSTKVSTQSDEKGSENPENTFASGGKAEIADKLHRLERGLPRGHCVTSVMPTMGRKDSRCLGESLLTKEESESRDGSWSLAALRTASQGEPSEGTSLDAMGV